MIITYDSMMILLCFDNCSNNDTWYDIHDIYFTLLKRFNLRLIYNYHTILIMPWLWWFVDLLYLWYDWYVVYLLLQINVVPVWSLSSMSSMSSSDLRIRQIIQGPSRQRSSSDLWAVGRMIRKRHPVSSSTTCYRLCSYKRISMICVLIASNICLYKLTKWPVTWKPLGKKGKRLQRLQRTNLQPSAEIWCRGSPNESRMPRLPLWKEKTKALPALPLRLLRSLFRPLPSLQSLLRLPILPVSKLVLGLVQ